MLSLGAPVAMLSVTSLWRPVQATTADFFERHKYKVWWTVLLRLNLSLLSSGCPRITIYLYLLASLYLKAKFEGRH